MYLNTPGGSVFDGLKIIEEIRKYNMSCIVENAYPAWVIIFQSFKIDTYYQMVNCQHLADIWTLCH